MAEIPPEVIEAIKRRDYVVCYAKCTPCQFGGCPGDRHSWMESEDLDHAGIATPTTPEGWAALAKDKPCGCHCQQEGAVATLPSDALEPDDRDAVWGPDDYETAADVEADTYPPHVVTEHGLSERGLL